MSLWHWVCGWEAPGVARLKRPHVPGRLCLVSRGPWVWAASALVGGGWPGGPGSAACPPGVRRRWDALSALWEGALVGASACSRWPGRHRQGPALCLPSRRSSHKEEPVTGPRVLRSLCVFRNCRRRPPRSASCPGRMPPPSLLLSLLICLFPQPHPNPAPSFGRVSFTT